MCGRFTLTTADVEALARELAAELDRARGAPWRPRYNVAPSDLHWVVVAPGGRRLLRPARFGLGAPGGPLRINARSESADRLPSFRHLFREGRCLVPVDGFFEWIGPPGARRPLWFHRAGGGLLLLAGLCQEQPEGMAFAILTTDANGPVRRAHDRMPAVLSPQGAAAWLERPDPSLLAPAPDDWLLATEVSSRVNSTENDDPACLEPAAPRQGSLF